MHMSPKIDADVKTIIWDLDGTLLDSFGIYRDCLNQVLRDLQIPEAPEIVLRNNHHGHIEESIANVLQDIDQAVSGSVLSDIMSRFYKLDNAYIKDVEHHLFGDAVDLAKRFHAAGKQQIIVTNRPHGVNRGNGSPRNLIAGSSLRHYMAAILCGDDSNYRKPLRACLEAQYGADLATLGKMVVVGDQFVDAEFAKNVGCNAILVARTGSIAHADKLANNNHIYITASLDEVTL